VQLFSQWKINVLHILQCVFVALRIQHAMRLRHIVICGLPGSSIFFHIFSYTVRFSGEKTVIGHKTCVLNFSSNVSGTFLTLRVSETDMVKNVCCSSCKLRVIPVRCYWNLNFPYRFSTKTQISNLWKYVQRESSCSMRSDEKTYRSQRPKIFASEIMDHTGVRSNQTSDSRFACSIYIY